MSTAVLQPQPVELRQALLARYQAGEQSREIVLLTSATGCRLVVDRGVVDHSDPRLLASLASEEPPENAQLICDLYLGDEHRISPRPLHSDDLHGDEPTQVEYAALSEVADQAGRDYRISRHLPAPKGFLELGWTRQVPFGHQGPVETLSLRDVVAALESYEPACAMTLAALADARERGQGSPTRLAGELARLQSSPIVLNRRLREAVLEHVERGQSMSEIAMRCGRFKRDRNGNTSGETSWLGRRIGLQPEGGKRYPTPWVHSDVLALIARDGLGLTPMDVEL